MLRLRKCIVSHLVYCASSPSTTYTSPLLSLRRLLSATAAPISPPNSAFAVEDYLVSTCGLTRAQALKASTKLSHLKSPSKPDAVLAFLAGLGLSRADVAAVVAKDPQFLCASVERTLAPNVVELSGLGLSRSEIARLVSLLLVHFRCRSISSKLQYYVPLFGSSENLFRALKKNPRFIGSHLDRVVKPNVALLRECGLGACDIAKVCLRRAALLTTSLERVQAVVVCAEGLGVPRGSGMFKKALVVVASRSEETIAAKVEYLKRTLGWSDAEVGIALPRVPQLLDFSEDTLRRKSEFLIAEVGLEPAYIAQSPVILSLSLEGRLRPRHYVVKFLKENGLLRRDWSFVTAMKESEKVFMERYVRAHEKAAPHLAEDYAAACGGEVPLHSPNSAFAVEDYLVSTCGLTRPQALKASTKLSHLSSPTNPDAVLAFLAGLGLSGADVAAVVANDPSLLCARVERTLAPNVAELAGLGMSRSEIARLVPLAFVSFRRRSIVRKLQYFTPLLGSSENLLRALKRNFYLLSFDLDRVVKPNVALLRECGLDACNIAKLCLKQSSLLGYKPERLRAMVACAEGLGVPRGSGMFSWALQTVAFCGEKRIAAKVEYMKRTCRWSDAEVGIALCRAPQVLITSEDMLRRKSEFLIAEVGLEPAYIAHWPVMLCLSLEGRLRPRYYVVKFLKKNELLWHDRSYITAIKVTEKVFMERYVRAHEKAAPHLAEDYAAACRGEVPARFRFASTNNRL